MCSGRISIVGVAIIVAVLRNFNVDVKGIFEGMHTSIRATRGLNVFPLLISKQIIEGLSKPPLNGPHSSQINSPHLASLFRLFHETILPIRSLVRESQKGATMVLNRYRIPCKAVCTSDGSRRCPWGSYHGSAMERGSKKRARQIEDYQLVEPRLSRS